LSEFILGIVSNEVFLSIAGIILSVLFFIIPYRRAVSARKERANSANAEVERIMLRRIFLESHTPRLDDIYRLLEGKARDFHVRIQTYTRRTKFSM